MGKFDWIQTEFDVNSDKEKSTLFFEYLGSKNCKA